MGSALAERTRSAGRAAFRLSIMISLQQGDQSVRWFKRSFAQMRRHDRLNRLEFCGRIGTSVDFRSGQITVSQPEGDLANIVGGLEHGHRTSVPQNMW